MSEEDDRLESVTESEKLRLKEGRLRHMRIREWEFKAIKEGKVILLAKVIAGTEVGGHWLGVLPEDKENQLILP